MTRRLTCHCGAVEIAFTPSEPLTDANRCDCSYCRRRGAATVSVPSRSASVSPSMNGMT